MRLTRLVVLLARLQKLKISASRVSTRGMGWAFARESCVLALPNNEI